MVPLTLFDLDVSQPACDSRFLFREEQKSAIFVVLSVCYPYFAVRQTAVATRPHAPLCFGTHGRILQLPAPFHPYNPAYRDKVCKPPIRRWHYAICIYVSYVKKTLALVREGTIPIYRLPLVGKVSANFCGQRISPGKRDGSPRQ
jgi:hypothetical protein